MSDTCLCQLKLDRDGGSIHGRYEIDPKCRLHSGYTPDRLKDTPAYYRTADNDLYDSFILNYGLEVWLRHVEMEVIQYVLRAPKKGSYREDIQKALVILERILTEMSKEKD